jgi:nucleotide-binding universal stress UspA family protein
MWDRLLLAIDQFESGQAAADFATGLALRSGADVRVFHVREMSNLMRVPPLETISDAGDLVDEAVFRLRVAGVGADGRSRSARTDDVGDRIADEASLWQCDAIVLGSIRRRGFDRISGCGVRESVLRRSTLAVLVAPSALHCDTRCPVESGAGTRGRHRRHLSS